MSGWHKIIWHRPWHLLLGTQGTRHSSCLLGQRGEGILTLAKNRVAWAANSNAQWLRCWGRNLAQDFTLIWPSRGLGAIGTAFPVCYKETKAGGWLEVTQVWWQPVANQGLSTVLVRPTLTLRQLRGRGRDLSKGCGTRLCLLAQWSPNYPHPHPTTPWTEQLGTG